MIEKETYYLVDVKQKSSDWLYLRKGRITGSNLAKTVGHASSYCKLSPVEIAEILTGVKKEENFCRYLISRDIIFRNFFKKRILKLIKI